MNMSNEQPFKPHNGGPCPVAKGTKVDVIHRDGEVFYNQSALETHPRETGDRHARFWDHDDCPGDIVAWRLHVVLYHSPEAAVYETREVTGWFDRHGQFWRDFENGARYNGCTHRQCECGEIYERNSYCKPCNERKRSNNFNAKPKAIWDREAALYCEASDEFFAGEEDLEYFMADRELTFTDMRLVICKPNYLRELDSDHFIDELPEDGELPADVEEAMEVFNKALRSQGPVSWSPGTYAVALKWVSDAVWYQPWTWDAGHYEIA